ncbi:MAG: alkaline phosphatase family protein [Deltaproteobacteria bacterium]|nr:MAG: alkaline phosphatase family protein [Deltaproteobacteria bacterium]
MVGHAVLATGGFPWAHGMVANVWMSRETGELGHTTQECNLEHAGSSGGHCPALSAWGKHSSRRVRPARRWPR